MFSTMMFSRVRKESLGQCRNTPGLRLRGLLLPRNIVSRFGQQFAAFIVTCHKALYSLQVELSITYGGELLVGGPPVEDLRELGVRPVLVAEDLLEAGGGEHEVAEAVHIGAGLQHHARAVTLHLT